MNPLVLLLILFFGMVAIKIPVAYSLGLSSILVIKYLGLPITSVVNTMFASVNSFPLLAIPFFLLLGKLMNDGGITDRLFRLSDALVGHIKGGLGHINVLISMLFAGLSGSAQADTAGIGSMLIPTMIKSGYDRGFTVAITACSSVLGVIIPPSVLMVVYGAMGGVSVGALMLAGVVPGLLIGFSQMGYTYYMAKKHGYPAGERKPLKEMGKSFLESIPSLALPFFILGGVTVGFFTATESAAFSAIYALILMFVVYRSYDYKDLPKLFKSTVVDFSLSMFAVASAGTMGWLIAYLNAPAMISNWILGITQSYIGVFMLLIVFLLIVGTFLSPMTSIIIFLPIIQELGKVANIHPIHMGIITILTLSLGMVTPPYGTCLMIAAQIGEMSIPKAFRAVLPIIGIALLIVIAGVLIPDLFLFLPKLLMPDFM